MVCHVREVCERERQMCKPEAWIPGRSSAEYHSASGLKRHYTIRRLRSSVYMVNSATLGCAKPKKSRVANPSNKTIFQVGDL